MSNTVFLVVIRCRRVCACIHYIYIQDVCLNIGIYDVYKFIEIISLSIDSEKNN